MKILISGASGLVGQALTEHLQQAGHEIFQLTRRGQSDNSRILSWNPSAGELSLPPKQHFDAVVHLGGANIAEGRWTQRRKLELRDSRITSTTLLANTLAELPKPPKVFACASAVGIYGDRGDELLSEDAPAADDFLGNLGRDWEAATAPAQTAGIRVVNLRFGIILSPKGGALAKMIPAFRLGLGGIVGSGTQYWSWISLADASRAVEFCLHTPLSGPVNIVSPNAATNRQFTRELGSALHRPTWIPLPAPLARLALGEMADAALLSSTHVQPTKLLSAGFQFLHPKLPEALAGLRIGR